MAIYQSSFYDKRFVETFKSWYGPCWYMAWRQYAAKVGKYNLRDDIVMQDKQMNNSARLCQMAQ